MLFDENEKLTNYKAKYEDLQNKISALLANEEIAWANLNSALQDENGLWINKLKLSEQKIKINNPGMHQVSRFFRNDKFLGDMIYDINYKTNSGIMIDPNDSTKSKRLFNEYGTVDIAGFKISYIFWIM